LNGIECLKEAAAKNKNDYESLQYLGQGYLYGAKAFDKSNYIPAERNLGNAIKLRPNAPLALAMLGVVYYDSGRLEKAGDVLAKAIYVNPKDPQAHYYYGLYFEKIGKRDFAKRQFAITIEIDSSHEKARVAYDKLTQQGF
jgi:Flp pilus assembly protein TadD